LPCSKNVIRDFWRKRNERATASTPVEPARALFGEGHTSRPVQKHGYRVFRLDAWHSTIRCR
jgi:hypothetical protein